MSWWVIMLGFLLFPPVVLLLSIAVDRLQRRADSFSSNNVGVKTLKPRMVQESNVEKVLTKEVSVRKTKLTAEQQEKLDELYRKLSRRWSITGNSGRTTEKEDASPT